MKIPAPPRGTPVGAAAITAALVTIILRLLSRWQAWASVFGPVQDSVGTVLTFLLTYLGGWLAVVRAPGQQVRMELTPSPLPTVQAVPVEAVQDTGAPAEAATGGGEPPAGPGPQGRSQGFLP